MHTRFKIAIRPSRAHHHKLIALAVLLALTWPGERQASGQEVLTLKIRNDLKAMQGEKGYNATIAIRSLQSLTPADPWRTVDVGPGRIKSLEIASPDKYLIRATAGGVTYESDAIALKKMIRENPKYELTLSRAFGAPAGARPKIMLSLALQSPDDDGIGDSQHIEFKPVGSRR